MNPETLLAGKYRMGRKLGGGSFGEPLHLHISYFVDTLTLLAHKFWLIFVALNFSVLMLQARSFWVSSGCTQSPVMRSAYAVDAVLKSDDNACLRLPGTNIQTGEEVGVKLEPVKARHPQLLYESKLYKILQGGGKIFCDPNFTALRC